MKKKYNVLKSYTMETSMCGSDITPTKGFYYSIKILNKIGKCFGKALYLCFNKNINNINYEQIIMKEIKSLSKGKNDDNDRLIDKHLFKIKKIIINIIKV